MDKLTQLYEKGLSRRNFLVGAGAIGAATLVAGCNDSGTVAVTPTPSPAAAFTDTDILNFALNLEYLEAEFYLRAAGVSGGLAVTDIGTGTSTTGTGAGAVTAGSSAQVPGLTAAQQQILNEIAFEEQSHVRFLRTALGSLAVARPAIDLSFFGNLATAAGITGGTFNPFASFDAFLIGAFIFEDVGVTAYSGAAGLISSAGITAGYLNAAAGILAVEAYHAGYVRTTITARGITNSSNTYIAIANQVAALRGTLSVGSNAGNTETNLVLPTTTATPSAIVAASTSGAIGFARTVNQVHHIVYGSATVGVAKGGFFPQGTNSIFATTTA